MARVKKALLAQQKATQPNTCFNDHTIVAVGGRIGNLGDKGMEVFSLSEKKSSRNPKKKNFKTLCSTEGRIFQFRRISACRNTLSV